MLAQYMLRLCVCPSVRLCLSQVGVLLKWLNIVSLRDVNEPIFLLFRHCTPTIASVVNSIRPSLVYHTERPPPSTARCREAARCAVRRRQPILAEFWEYVMSRLVKFSKVLFFILFSAVTFSRWNKAVYVIGIRHKSLSRMQLKQLSWYAVKNYSGKDGRQQRWRGS